MFVARQKELESPTFRLGGGRSILLSYGDIYQQLFYLILRKSQSLYAGGMKYILETAPGTDVFRTAAEEDGSPGCNFLLLRRKIGFLLKIEKEW